VPGPAGRLASWATPGGVLGRSATAQARTHPWLEAAARSARDCDRLERIARAPAGRLLRQEVDRIAGSGAGRHALIDAIDLRSRVHSRKEASIERL
jgi:hypothetical protein